MRLSKIHKKFWEIVSFGFEKGDKNLHSFCESVYMVSGLSGVVVKWEEMIEFLRKEWLEEIKSYNLISEELSCDWWVWEDKDIEHLKDISDYVSKLWSYYVDILDIQRKYKEGDIQ